MTTTFSKPVLDIVLPASETAEEPSRKNAELLISVKADGTIHYQEQQLTKEALTAVLETRPEALLNLYVDEKAPFEAFCRRHRHRQAEERRTLCYQHAAK